MDFRMKNRYHFRFLSLRGRVQFYHAINTASKVGSVMNEDQKGL